MGLGLQMNGRGVSGTTQAGNEFAWGNAGFGNAPWVVNAVTAPNASGSASSASGVSVPVLLGGLVLLLLLMRKKRG